jgi:hypothetical protein
VHWRALVPLVRRTAGANGRASSAFAAIRHGAALTDVIPALGRLTSSFPPPRE